MSRLPQQPVLPQQPAAGQPAVAQPVVMQQPMLPQQPVLMQPVLMQQPVLPQQPAANAGQRPGMPDPPNTPRLRIYGHSTFLYWWPVWAVGYVMAGLTYFQGKVYEIGTNPEMFHPSSSLGVTFLMVLFLVIVMTNFTVRGTASGVVILCALLMTLFLAYMNWWDYVLGFFFDLKVGLNLGAYFWFSTALFVTWFVSVFIVDHMTYYQVEPGQVTRNVLFGAGSKSFNAQGMALEKHQADLFQNWILGMGSGNLVIHTTGAAAEKIEVPNVLFVGWKLQAMEELIAMEPAVPGQS